MNLNGKSYSNTGDYTVSYTFAPNTLARSCVASKKRAFRMRVLSLARAGMPVVLHSYWDGGSKDVYHTIGLDGRPHAVQPAVWTGNFGGNPNASFVQVPGQILVCTGTSMGKPATPSFTVLSTDADAFAAGFCYSIEQSQY